MDYNVLIHPEARLELLDAFSWYQEQRQGLGYDFKLCIEEVLSKLAKNPTIYRFVQGEVRRAIIRRFPFGIFYIIEEETVIVLAVVHARRNSQNWKRRI